MMIQPYLENKVVHGLGNLKDRKGLVTVMLTKVGDGTRVTITDNGVGREKAIELRRLRVGNEHVSRAMHINEERVSLLKDVYGSEDFKVEVTDLTNEKGSLGTQVDIYIPHTD